MRGRRNARSRARGSWAARLTGVGVAIALAAAGVAAYLIAGGAQAGGDGTGLPTRVLGTQAVSVVDPGPPQQAGSSPGPWSLLASRGVLAFTAAGQAGAGWTADQMAGGTYIFIYLTSGLCLQSSHASAVALARCNLDASQRWVRQHLVISASGPDYWQLRNLSDGRCLTAAGQATAAGAAARLDPCQAPPGRGQQIALLTMS